MTRRRFQDQSILAPAAAALGMLALLLGCQGETAKPTDTPRPPAAKAMPAEQSSPGTLGEQRAPSTQPASAADKKLTANEILHQMAEAYQKAQSYADTGKIRLEAESGGEKFIDEVIPLSVAMERPNKLRMHAYQAMMVCDGRQIHAALDSIPRQVLIKPAPPKLGLKMFRIDPSLFRAIADFAGPPPQLVLLTSEDPLGDLLRGVDETKLLEPAQIDGQACYRIQLARPEGLSMLWIDQKTMLLRRVVLSTDALRADLPKDKPIDRLSLVMDISDARFNQSGGPDAYRFEMPKDALAVDLLIPPHIADSLAKPAPAFKFYDSKGNPVTPQSLLGKIVILDFWATYCVPCRESLPLLQQVYEKYKNNPKVAILAVSVDQLQTKDEDLQKFFQQLKLSMPMLRDKDDVARAFNFPGIPAMFILDAKGVVQDCEGGFDPKLLETLPAKIEKLLKGQDVFDEPLKRHQEEIEQLKRYAKEFELAAEKPAAPEGLAVTEEKLPEVKISPRSEPAHLKLSPLWKCDDVKYPGNIVRMGRKDGTSRLMVLDGMQAIAEVGLDGKLIARHPLDLAEKEKTFGVGILRTGSDADGRSYLAAYMPTQQRCHLLDESGRVLGHYPANALENPHSGIAEVQLGDLNGDGRLKLYVGYWGAVGVQAASLEGARLWNNRTVANVGCLAFGPANAQRQRDLYLTNETGGIGVLSPAGDRRGSIAVRGRVLYRIASADLLGNGALQWCGLSTARLGENTAVGFDLNGTELWNYELPHGVHAQPIEPIIAGTVLPGSNGQWILPGPDGSIHILSAKGKLIDRFNYGALIQGLAVATVQGQPALVIASPGRLEAWKLETSGK